MLRQGECSAFQPSNLLQLNKSSSRQIFDPAKKFDDLSAGKRPNYRPNRMVVLNRAVIKGVCSIYALDQETN